MSSYIFYRNGSFIDVRRGDERLPVGVRGSSPAKYADGTLTGRTWFEEFEAGTLGICAWPEDGTPYIAARRKERENG